MNIYLTDKIGHDSISCRILLHGLSFSRTCGHSGTLNSFNIFTQTKIIKTAIANGDVKSPSAFAETIAETIVNAADAMLTNFYFADVKLAANDVDNGATDEFARMNLRRQHAAKLLTKGKAYACC